MQTTAVRVNGHELHYSDTGGGGEPVILGHGYFLDHTIFAAQAEALSPRWRVICWDAPAHGGTPDRDEPLTYWDAAWDVLGLMDALGLPAATVGGVSQGGFIALRTALLAPDRVTSLVLMDTEATACDSQDKAAYQGLFTALSEAGPVDEIAIGLSMQLLGDNEYAPLWRQRWRDRDTLPLGVTARCLLDRDDVSSRLGEIRCPALLVWGAEDRSLPRERMELLRDRLPAATEIQVIDGAAHTPALTHPNRVNEVLVDFLQGLASRR